MSFDVGRVRHLAEQMHRSEDDAGDPIDAGKVLAATGDTGLEWVDVATVSDDTPLIESGAGDPGVSAEASRSDHVHPEFGSSGGIGEILISDTHSTPLVFADLLQNESGSDLLYADP